MSLCAREKRGERGERESTWYKPFLSQFAFSLNAVSPDALDLDAISPDALAKNGKS